MEQTAQFYYIRNDSWKDFLKEVSAENLLYAPKETLFGLEYSLFEPENISEIVYPKARLTLPLKYFFYPPIENVSTIPSAKKSVLLGVKACDLNALLLLDEIFMDKDFTDPFYKSKRENTLIISDDCSSPLEGCFCTLLGGNPFAENVFDLNISFMEKRLLVEVGSEKGEKFLKQEKAFLKSDENVQLKARNLKREKAVQYLRELNRDFKIPQMFPGLLQNKHDLQVWDEVAKLCVGCCACTNICPACHCFLLGDVSPERLSKERYWDSCQYTGFARVAGGANPRKKLVQRFSNRLYCKFEHKPRNFNLLACTGCGRCIEACQGKIDIRKVLSDVANQP